MVSLKRLRTLLSSPWFSGGLSSRRASRVAFLKRLGFLKRALAQEDVYYREDFTPPPRSKKFRTFPKLKKVLPPLPRCRVFLPCLDSLPCPVCPSTHPRGKPHARPQTAGLSD